MQQFTLPALSMNEKLFGTYKKKHGGVWTIANAFYSEDIHWSADISVPDGITAEFLDQFQD